MNVCLELNINPRFICFVFLSQKRPVSFDSLERLAVKRQKLVDQRLQQQPAVNGLLNHNSHEAAAPSLNPSLHSEPEIQPNTLTGNQNGLPGGQNSFPFTHKLSSRSETCVSESTEQETKASSLQLQQSDSDCLHQQLAANPHRKSSKKHRDKEREWLKDNKDSRWLETSPDLKQNPDKLDSKKTVFSYWNIFYLRGWAPSKALSNCCFTQICISLSHHLSDWCIYAVLSHKRVCVCSFKLALQGPLCVLWLTQHLTRCSLLLSPDTCALLASLHKTQAKDSVTIHAEMTSCHFYLSAAFIPDPDIVIAEGQKPDYVLWVCETVCWNVYREQTFRVLVHDKYKIVTGSPSSC